MKDLTLQQPQPVARITFTKEDEQLIRDTICRGGSDSEFKLFINQCRTTGLNPLARQAFAVMRWDSSLNRNAMSIQVSIDGFRLIAERTEKYAGQIGPFWCGEDGVWKDVWISDKPPTAAKIGALRTDFKEPCWGVARFGAYAQKKKDGGLVAMWVKMGDVMIAKCAEALALRKAFPQELSGLYTTDEMEQATPIEQSETVKEPKPIVPDDMLLIVERAKEMAKEIELADMPEKLEAIVGRFAINTSMLATKLPKWHAKIIEMIDNKREEFKTSDEIDPDLGRELLAG